VNLQVIINARMGGTSNAGVRGGIHSGSDSAERPLDDPLSLFSSVLPTGSSCGSGYLGASWSLSGT